MSDIQRNLPDYEKAKKELQEKFTPTGTYLGSFVRNAIQGTSFKPNNLGFQVKPKIIKKGDVVLVHQGVKPRPCCVVKVVGDTVCYIPLTSSDNIHCLSESSSRFWGDGSFCKTFDICTLEYALDNFIGVYDNPKLLNRAIKELKEYITDMLK